MNNLDNIYDSYFNDVKEEFKSLKNDVSLLEKTKRDLQDMYKKKFGLRILKISLQTLDTSTSIKDLEFPPRLLARKNTQYRIALPTQEHYDSLIAIVEKIIITNQEIKVSKKKLKKFDSNIIPKYIFKTVMLSYLDKKRKSIIYNGDILNLGKGLGYIEVKARINKGRKIIDKKKSQENKQNLIARGGIPYEVTARNEFGKAISDNGGDYYLEYITEPILYSLYWNRMNTKLENLKCSDVFFTKGENGITTELHKAIRTYPEIKDIHYKKY